MALRIIITAGLALLAGADMSAEPAKAPPKGPSNLKAPEVLKYSKNLDAKGEVRGQFTNVADRHFGYPHLMPGPNETSFDRWYFDAVNPSNIADSATITFNLATNESFPQALSGETNVNVELTLSFADGTAMTLRKDADPDADSSKAAAVFQNDVAASVLTGDFTGSASFKTTQKAIKSPMGYVSALVNIPTGKFQTVDGKVAHVSGFLSAKRLVPSHFPCSTDIKKPGESLAIMPMLGWTDQMPYADADFWFKVQVEGGVEQAMYVKGAQAHHDQMWSVQPFQDRVKSWLSGHARLGELTIVWAQAADHENKLHSSVYLSKRGSNHSSIACQDRLVAKLLQIENTDQYTKLAVATKDPEGIMGQFEFTMEKNKKVGGFGAHNKWTGKATGCDNDDEEMEAGVAMFQEYHF